LETGALIACHKRFEYAITHKSRHSWNVHFMVSFRSLLARIREIWAMRSTRAYAAWMDRDFHRWRQSRNRP